MDKKTALILAGFILVAVLIIGGAMLTLGPDRIKEGAISENSTTTDPTGSQNNTGGEVVDSGSIVDVGLVSIVEDRSVPHPPINREVQYGPYVSPDVKIVIAEKLAEVRANLSEEEYSYPDWLELGVLYSTAGDYKGAEEVWLYLNQASPNQSISFSNLGNLYHFDLKDFPKSEANFKAAIEKNATQPLYYHNLHELYKYSYKTDTNLAVEILEQGLAANPDNLALMMDLARYYKDTGQKEKAITAFNEAREVAEAQGQTSVVAAIDVELKALNQQ